MLYIVTFILLTFILYYFDSYSIIKNTTIPYYKKYKKLNNMVRLQHSGNLKVLKMCFILFLKVLYISICQFLNKSIVVLDKNTYEISYVLNGKLYKMIVKPSLGPSKILLISDEHNNDITTEILPYLGPQYNFHGNDYSPNFFKENIMKFELSSGEQKTFIDNDIIKL